MKDDVATNSVRRLVSSRRPSVRSGSAWSNSSSGSCLVSRCLICLVLFCTSAGSSPAEETEADVISAGSGVSVPSDAASVPELRQTDFDIRTRANRLYVLFRTLPKNNELRIPRLGNSVRAIHWSDTPKNEVPLKPEVDSWIITLPERTDGSAKILVIELDGPLTLMTDGLSDKPRSDGIIVLPASHGVPRGKNLRFEPQPHKNTVGYWSLEGDTVEWKFESGEAAEYEIDILQGCGKGHGGSHVQILLNGKKTAEFDVTETGHFQNFIWRTVGSISLSSGSKQTLKIVPVKKVAGAVMDVRAVRLVPKNSAADRPMTPELADPGALPAGL